jgi:hypothetical protein
VMLTLALLGDHRLDRAAKPDLVSDGASADEVQQKIGSRHGASVSQIPLRMDSGTTNSTAVPVGISRAPAAR